MDVKGEMGAVSGARHTSNGKNLADPDNLEMDVDTGYYKRGPAPAATNEGKEMIQCDTDQSENEGLQSSNLPGCHPPVSHSDVRDTADGVSHMHIGVEGNQSTSVDPNAVPFCK
jgi:hypothetical protein